MISLNENNILSNLDLSKKEILGKGFVSEAYKVKLLNNKENEYTILKGLIKDSYKCYEDSYNNLKFIYNNGNPLIKSIKIPSTVTKITPTQMLLKHARSSPNFTKIIYNGTTPFNWYKLTGSDMTPSDITESQTFTTNQTIRHPYGDIVVSPY